DGLYTPGRTAGKYQVIATQQGGTLSDTAQITVADTVTTTPPPPPPSSGKTFFLANAESGNLGAWNVGGWEVVQQNGTVTAAQAKVKDGSWAYKYEVTSSGNPTVGAVGHD